MREITLEGAKLIGEGYFSKVYKIAEDEIIKVYVRNTPIEDIDRERELSRTAFIKGLPTAITFDVVKVGDKYGVVYEMLDGKSFGDAIKNDKENLDANIKKYADLLKEFAAADAGEDNRLPSANDQALEKAEKIKPFITSGEYEKIVGIIKEMSRPNTFVHGDCHVNNLISSGDNIYVIDMDTLSSGNPVFELAAIYCTYIAFEEFDPGNNERFLKIPNKIVKKIWHGTFDNYFNGSSDEVKERNMQRVQLLAYFHMLFWIKTFKPEDTAMFDGNYARFRECLSVVKSGDFEM
ncbi:TIGR02172 family protein [Lachnospiraceae bacterium KH1T2]|nr:TIGR02172 family protein [Lachnospiraceae bacterium KH1T2]